MKTIHATLAMLIVVAAALFGASAEARFLANDPVPFDPTKPAQFNRYAYAWNDPINAVDPDGRQTMMLPADNSVYHKIGANLGNPDSTQARLMGLTPVVGDLLGFAEAFADPSPANISAAAAGLVPIAGDAAGPLIRGAGDGIASARRAGRAPEFDGGEISESGFLEQASGYLGDNYSEVSPGRYLSGDGTRQVRYGSHETSNPSNHHGHFESVENGRVTENTSVRIVPDERK